MGIRVFVSHLLRLNIEELPELPPFGGRNQALTAQEIREIVIKSCPQTWKDKMVEQGFIPEQNTLQHIVAFCERLESIEEEAKSIKPITTHNSKGKGKPESKPKSDGKWCTIHKSTTHTTEECKANPNNQKADGKPFYKNKTWNKSKAEENKSITAKEVNAIIKQYMDNHSKAKNNQVGKRKSEANMIELLPNSEENEEDNMDDIEIGSDIEANEAALAEIDRQLAEINALEEAVDEANT